MQNQLNEKADLIHVNNALENKVNSIDNESIRLNLEKINREIVNKLDFNKFEAYMNDSRSALDEMQKELSMKSNLKDVNLLICKKLFVCCLLYTYLYTDNVMFKNIKK